MAEVMLSKLMPPENAPNLIVRERLLRSVLNNKQTRVTLINAPAGYGKTVLALQLSRQIDKPLAWLHLDRNDNDPSCFLQCLIKSIRCHWPSIGERALQLTTRGEIVGKQPHFITSLIINDLTRFGANPLLVLDDYHELEEPLIHSLVQELLEHLPAGVFLIITSRITVPLSLFRFFLSGEACQLGPAELCFTKDEIARFLLERYGPHPENTVQELENYTGGWPAALELAGALPNGTSFPDPKQKPGSGYSIYDYLAEEVFEKLSPEYRDFLLNTAVFKVLRPELCNLLLERSDSEIILKTLGEKMLLLTPLSGAKNTYRCHQLFRDFLLDRLGERQLSLQRRAGRIARIQGNIEKAVEHFLLAGFDEETLAMLEEAGGRTFRLGRWHTLARWLEQLTESQIASSSWLSYYQAVVEAYRGCLYEAQRWVEFAAARFTTENIGSGLAECLILQARLTRCRGRYMEAMAFLDQASAEFNEEEIAQRFDLILEKGLCLALAGKMRAAEDLLSKALVTVKKTGNGLVATCLAETLGHLHYQQGRHAIALRTYQEAIHYSPDQSLPNYYIQDAIPYIYRDWGELDKAMEWARKSVEAKERYKLVETLPSAYCALSYVYFELNDFETVELYIRKALKLLYEHGSERYFLLLNQSLLAWCHYARGCWVEAEQLIEDTLIAAEVQSDLACGLVETITGTVLALMGNFTKAGEVLHRAEINLENMNFKTRLCEAYKALAYVHYAMGEEKLFHKYARKFLHLGAHLNYVGNAILATADMLEPTLYFSLESDVEVTFAQRVLVRLGKRAHKLLLDLSGHPNPAVRQRVIAPLVEIADDTAVQTISRLSRDKTSAVRHSALAYTTHSPTAFYIPHQKAKIATREVEPQLEVKTFGSFQIFAGKQEITGWRTRKTRELLALLLHLEVPVNKEKLMEELWPDLDPLNNSALFRTTMHYLRRHLEYEGITDLIRFNRDSYSLKPGLCKLDCVSFEKLVNAGLQEEPLREAEAALLIKAERLYRGDYLAVPSDYTWALPRQIRLKHQYIETLLTLARYYRIRSKNNRAKDFLLKLKDAGPLCEPAHRLLLQVYFSLGDRQAVIKEHDCFKRMLQEEIGLLPEPETREVYRRLGCH